MLNPSISVKLSCQELIALPGDLLRHELIDGEHIVSQSPNVQHQRALRKLGFELELFLRRHARGEIFFAPFDILLSAHDLVEPDLFYVSNQRRRQQLTAKRLVGPPDLVAEVVSASTRALDETRKLRLYERFAVSEYWLIDPEREAVRIYQLVEKRFVLSTLLTRQDAAPGLSTPLLPGLSIQLAAIFG
jgi:Uma2 family endonuclease